MDLNTLLTALDFTRSRLLGSLDLIEKSGQDTAKALAWRPAPGRAHIAWQAMHCAATHDKFVNVTLKGAGPKDEALVANYGINSVPSDQNVPTLADIRSTLESHFSAFRGHLAGLKPEDLSRKLPSNRTLGEAIMLYTWHEAHHQGQIHLTWNLYKQAQGIK